MTKMNKTRLRKLESLVVKIRRSRIAKGIDKEFNRFKGFYKGEV